MSGPSDARRPRRRGPRSDSSDLPDRVLAAAKRSFADRGYERTTIRQVARDAGVDPAMVLYLHGTKEQLFRESLRLTLHPETLVAALDEDQATIGRALADRYLQLWESPDSHDTLVATFIGASTHPEAAAAISAFFTDVVLGPIRERLGPGIPPVRFALAATQLVGVAFGRYVLKFPLLAQLPREELIELLAPTLQRYLTEPDSTRPLRTPTPDARTESGTAPRTDRRR